MSEEIESLIHELKDIYCNGANDFNDFETIRKSRLSPTIIADLIYVFHGCIDQDQAIKTFIERYNISDKSELDIIAALKNILSYVHRKTLPNPNLEKFISKCAKLHLLTYRTPYAENDFPSYPKNIINGSALIDLAPGADFINFLPQFSENSFYYPVDKALFPIECIRQKSQMLKLNNIKPIHKDVMELKREDIDCEAIETIRAKNIFAYVPTYLFVFQKHLSWLCAEGKFIFEEQSSEANANKPFLHKLRHHNR